MGGQLPVRRKQLGSSSKVDGFRLQVRDGLLVERAVLQFRHLNSSICSASAFGLVEPTRPDYIRTACKRRKLGKERRGLTICFTGGWTQVWGST